MITEDYVSFEVARLLKDKGFNEHTLHYYVEGHLLKHYLPLTNSDTAGISAPTFQMAMKWLREVHNLQILIAPINSRYKDWTFGIYRDFSPLTIKLICCPTYEKACEAAIKYCLENLI